MTDKGPHIVLIGFMGSGKSSVAKLLAERTGRAYFSCDDEIESRAGKAISAIFADDGEAAFRDLETEVIRSLAERTDPLIVDTGGGAPVREENRALLRDLGEVLYLRVTLDTVQERLSAPGETGKRPLSGELEQRYNDRLEIYSAAADRTIDCDNLTVEEIVDKIIEG